MCHRSFALAAATRLTDLTGLKQYGNDDNDWQELYAALDDREDDSVLFSSNSTDNAADLPPPR